MSTITTPALSDAAQVLFIADLGEANLEAFLQADVNDSVALHLTPVEGNVAQAEMIEAMPDELTVQAFADMCERGAAQNQAADQAAEEAIVDAPAEPAAPAVETPALVELVVEPVAEVPAADITAGTLDQAFDAAAETGTEVADTAASPEPVVAVAPSVVPRPSKVVASVMPETKATPDQPEWFDSLSTYGKALKQAFDQYQLKMKPRASVNDADVGRAQTSLARILFGTVNVLEGNDFQNMFSHILAQFHKHADGVFHEMYVFRGADVIELPNEERRLFANLLNLLKLTADPAGRATALKQVDLNKTLGAGISEAGRQKVYGFFNL